MNSWLRFALRRDSLSSTFVAIALFPFCKLHRFRLVPRSIVLCRIRTRTHGATNAPVGAMPPRDACQSRSDTATTCADARGIIQILLRRRLMGFYTKEWSKVEMGTSWMSHTAHKGNTANARSCGSGLRVPTHSGNVSCAPFIGYFLHTDPRVDRQADRYHSATRPATARASKASAMAMALTRARTPGEHILVCERIADVLVLVARGCGRVH